MAWTSFVFLDFQLSMSYLKLSNIRLKRNWNWVQDSWHQDSLFIKCWDLLGNHDVSVEILFAVTLDIFLNISISILGTFLVKAEVKISWCLFWVLNPVVTFLPFWGLVSTLQQYHNDDFNMIDVKLSLNYLRLYKVRFKLNGN